MRALNAWLWLHLDSIVDANNFHIGLEQDNFVNLLEVVNFLNLTIVRGPVSQVFLLLVAHIHLSSVLSIVLDLMLDQVRGKISEFDCGRIDLV